MTDTVTVKLAEWEALVEGATEGPWEVVGGEVHAPKLLDQVEPTDVATIFDPDADAEFIAAARTAMPALIAFVREVRAIHRVDSRFGECALCGERWPCPIEEAAWKWIGGAT